MKPQKYCALVRNREEPKNGISGTTRNREELFARNRDFVSCTIFAVSCGLHSFVLSKTKILTNITEDKDLTRCGNNHVTPIGMDRTNGTSLPATAYLPPVVRELVDGAPEKFRMPTFIACMAPLGCLATRLRFHYPYDRGPSAPLLQTIICSEISIAQLVKRTDAPVRYFGAPLTLWTNI